MLEFIHDMTYTEYSNHMSEHGKIAETRYSSGYLMKAIESSVVLCVYLFVDKRP